LNEIRKHRFNISLNFDNIISMNGFIYIMSNPSIKGKIKIGKSSSDPQSFRKQDLYTTATPEPFNVEYLAFVENFDDAEKKIHKILDKYRPNKGREFFNCSIPHAIATIESIAKIKYMEDFSSNPEFILLEKFWLNMKKKRKEQNVLNQKVDETILNTFNQMQLDKREKHTKLKRIYTDNLNPLTFYINMLAWSVGSFCALLFLYSFFISDTFDDLSDLIFFIMGGVILGYIITNHFKNRGEDKLIDESMDLYPPENSISNLRRKNETVYQNLRANSLEIRSIICFIDYHEDRGIYFNESHIHYAEMNRLSHLDYAQQIEKPSHKPLSIHVNSEKEALDMGFEKAPENYLIDEFEFYNIIENIQYTKSLLDRF